MPNPYLDKISTAAHMPNAKGQKGYYSTTCFPDLSHTLLRSAFCPPKEPVITPTNRLTKMFRQAAYLEACSVERPAAELRRKVKFFRRAHNVFANKVLCDMESHKREKMERQERIWTAGKKQHGFEDSFVGFSFFGESVGGGGDFGETTGFESIDYEAEGFEEEERQEQRQQPEKDEGEGGKGEKDQKKTSTSFNLGASNSYEADDFEVENELDDTFRVGGISISSKGDMATIGVADDEQGAYLAAPVPTGPSPPKKMSIEWADRPSTSSLGARVSTATSSSSSLRPGTSASSSSSSSTMHTKRGTASSSSSTTRSVSPIVSSSNNEVRLFSSSQERDLVYDQQQQQKQQQQHQQQQPRILQPKFKLKGLSKARKRKAFNRSTYFDCLLETMDVPRSPVPRYGMLESPIKTSIEAQRAASPSPDAHIDGEGSTYDKWHVSSIERARTGDRLGSVKARDYR